MSPFKENHSRLTPGVYLARGILQLSDLRGSLPTRSRRVDLRSCSRGNSALGRIGHGGRRC